jgi:hypothetical protein
VFCRKLFSPGCVQFGFTWLAAGMRASSVTCVTE